MRALGLGDLPASGCTGRQPVASFPLPAWEVPDGRADPGSPPPRPRGRAGRNGGRRRPRLGCGHCRGRPWAQSLRTLETTLGPPGKAPSGSRRQGASPARQGAASLREERPRGRGDSAAPPPGAARAPGLGLSGARGQRKKEEWDYLIRERSALPARKATRSVAGNHGTLDPHPAPTGVSALGPSLENGA